MASTGRHHNIHEVDMQPRLHHAVFGLLLLVITGCGGAYGEAIERGDKYAAAGQLDAAAAEYERAVAMKPDKPDAKIKLQHIRQRQAYQHVKRARALEDRGELAQALAVVHEAAALRPDDTFVQEEVTRLSDAVLTRAEERMAGDDPRAAFSLTTLVLKGAPSHPRAQRVDGEARAVLASRAYERAERFIDQGLLGNALVELAACTTYRRDMAEARRELGRIRLALHNELTFVVMLQSFAGAGSSQSLARGLSVATLRQSIDERLLIRVAPDDPAVNASPGIRLSGQLSGYGHDHDQRGEGRSCDYVCGTDYQPNPDRATAERELASAESDLARVDRDVASAEREVLDQEREIAGLQERVDRAQSDRDRAQQTLDRCLERAGDDTSEACRSERSRVQSEQRDLESARDRLRSPRDRLDSARRSLGQVRERRGREREEVERRRQRLRDTPETIAIDRHCAFDYQVAVHEVQSRITMNLTIKRLADDGAIVKDEPFQYSVAETDQTFRAIRGRCAEVSGGDPLELPSEAQLRTQLLQQIVRDVRAKLMVSYDSYRSDFLSAAREHESAGLSDRAVEAYVRYVLTGPHDLKDAESIGQFLEKARGFGAVDALWNQ